MKNRLLAVMLALLLFIITGCSVSQEDYTGNIIATPLQVETFVFQTKEIYKKYTAAVEQSSKALDDLLMGEQDKFQANAVFLRSRETAKECIAAIKDVNAPAQLRDIRDDLNFSIVYYQEALKTLRRYLDTENEVLLGEAQTQLNKAEEFLSSYQQQMQDLTKEDENQSQWY